MYGVLDMFSILFFSYNIVQLLKNVVCCIWFDHFYVAVAVEPQMAEEAD